MLNRPVKILCACGSGIATSTMIVSKLTALLDDNNVDAEVKKTTFAALPTDVMSVNPDLILTSSNIPNEYDVPMICGLAYLTGVGKAQLDEQILEAIKNME
ncbi:MAG: PTS sugar transporter subunit IIB [Mogibacterium sp.]|nr:PTS sugar transporter subunit IIB [Mogibacterium sp.]